MKILTAEQMRDVDRLTTERYGLPSIQLMEAAATRVAHEIEKHFGTVVGKRGLIICGKGNNGGDGAAVARLLYKKGCFITVLLLGRVEETKGDARANFTLARELAATGDGVRLIEATDERQFAEEVASAPFSDFFVDAIFGTGLSRPATGVYERAIEFLNGRSDDSVPIFSVDLPSGLNADSPEPIGKAVRATLTVTFTAPKVANVLPPACQLNGRLVVAPIGSPASLIEASGSHLNLVERPMVEAWLTSSRRTSDAHKGDAGKVLIIAGSRGKTGAACLAGEAAMRAGTGLVTIATAASAQPAVAARVIAECMTEALAEDEYGKVAFAAAARALEFSVGRDVVALGPGLGTPDDSLTQFVRRQITERRQPMVIDADGLNAITGWVDELRGDDEKPLILTPHPGEMARLTGKSIQDVSQDRVGTARDFALTHRVIVVLKGSRTVIAAPDGEVYVNPTGNAGMATGGSGDVLTGILAGLLAQKPDDAIGATIAGVYLHGLAGDLAASIKGVRALIASDITAHLGNAFITVGGAAEKP